ncbi:hypothetical protein [Dyadobacter sp. CY312]|uniref:hypothetical protein n=1 Tax=Dyadobacter sp. CY312 TaxID=2907303 RepID=UPI001F168FB7|nr:hypothetical protein [Dyadobacter sp. CY312]MCE7040782.1 hypothetical protein [Dyadobacter sp. CY312]
MLNRNVANSLNLKLLFVFANYGGLLLLSLTSLFGEWSGMASLGTFYLVLVAPIGMGFIAFQNRKTRNDSKYQKAAFWASALYFAAAPAVIISLILFQN